MFTSAPPISPRSFEETPFSWVSTPEDLAIMLDKLRDAKEIAIDLEYHNYRTFSGFVCLMQISTREEDFVVDTLALRQELEELNEVFTNPNIVKVCSQSAGSVECNNTDYMQVLHGAESDIVWLQQDFNLYIVNLFDTYHASKVLGMLSGPVRSLELNPHTRLPQARPRIFAGDVLRLHCGQAVSARGLAHTVCSSSRQTI